MPPNRQAACPCGSGKKYKSCCLATDRSREDLRAAVQRGHETIDGTLRVLLPLLESRGEHKIACAMGCNACCHTLVRASFAEAEQIADHLAAPAQAEVRGRFLAKLPAWRGVARERLATLDALIAVADGGTSSAGWEAYRTASDDYLRARNMCPFNEAGLCEIYPLRPVPCRTTYVTDTAEYCVPDRGRSPSTVTAPQLHEAVASASEEMARACQKSGLEARRRALPEMVAASLDARR